MTGAKLTPFFFIEKFNLINKVRSRIKVLELFEDSFKHFSTINASLISYGFVLKRSSEPLMKVSRVESIEESRKEYKKLLEEGWGQSIASIVFKNLVNRSFT